MPQVWLVELGDNHPARPADEGHNLILRGGKLEVRAKVNEILTVERVERIADSWAQNARGLGIAAAVMLAVILISAVALTLWFTGGRQLIKAYIQCC